MQQDFAKLIAWSAKFNFLPWRQNRNLYKTLVSEIMLQQTTVATVVKKFEAFLSLYPSLLDLAQATEEQILVAWKGLGYYRRAKNLLAAAKYIITQGSTEIPKEYNKLIKIPGIGDYTANAILAIGDQQRVLAVDTNIERVLARYYGLDTEKGTKLKKNILELFQDNKILNFNLSFRELNEALMDLGREYCKTTKANCSLCPMHSNCQSKQDPLARPLSSSIDRMSHDLSLLRVLIIENNHLLSYKKNDAEWLSGQWECPTFVVKSTNSIKQYPSINFSHEHLKSFRTTITKYKISNYILMLSRNEFCNLFDWNKELHPIPISDKNNLSTATQKALRYLKSE